MNVPVQRGDPIPHFNGLDGPSQLPAKLATQAGTLPVLQEEDYSIERRWEEVQTNEAGTDCSKKAT